MSSIIELDFVSVSERAAKIGCPLPEIAIMPENFAVARSYNELHVRSDAAALRSILENACFPLGSFCPAAEHATFREENFAHWEACLFISSTLVKREPYAVSVALAIIRDHLSNYFDNEPERTARLTLIVERKSDRACKKLVYEGEIAGLRSLAQAVSKFVNE